MVIRKVFTPTDDIATLSGQRPRAKTVGAAFRLLLERTARRVRAGVRSPATLSMQRQHIAYLRERLPDRTPLIRVDARRIAQVLELERRGRRDRALSGGTLRKRASTLRQAIRLAGGRVPAFPEIPYRYTPKCEHLPDFATYQQLRDALPVHRRLWFVVAVWTGQRFADVEAMRREDLNISGAWVRIRSSKTKRAGGRVAAAPELLRELADHWRRLQPGAKLVEAWPHCSSQLTRLSERLGLPRTTAHRLRHTFFTWFVASNGFTPELLELGGWKDLTIPAQVYAHAAPVRLQEQIGRLHRLVVQRLAPQKVSRVRAVSSRIDTALSRGEPGPNAAGDSAVDVGAGGVQPPPAPEPAHGDHADRVQDGHLTPEDNRGSVGAERIELSTNGLRVRCAR